MQPQATITTLLEGRDNNGEPLVLLQKKSGVQCAAYLEVGRVGMAPPWLKDLMAGWTIPQ